MAGDFMPASSNIAVNDYATGMPRPGQARNRSLGRLRLPELPVAVPRWIAYLAMGAMAFQAFFAMTHFGWQYRSEYGSFLLLVTLLLLGGQPWRELVAQPVAQAVLAFTAFLVLQAMYVTWIAPVTPAWEFSEQLTTASKLVRLGVFSCFLGWWLSLVPRAIPFLFALMVLGLLSGVLIFMPWGELDAVFDGQLRPRFGIPENLAGQLAAVAGWLAVCMMVAMWRRSAGRKRKAALIVTLLVAYLGCLCALIFSQSRGAWLAFAITLPVVLVGLWSMRGGRRFPMKIWAPLLIAGLLSGLLLVGARDILSTRLASAEQVLDSVEEGGSTKPVRVAEEAARPGAHDGSIAARPASARQEMPAAAASPSAPASGAAVVATPSGQALHDEVAVKAVNIRLQLYDLGVQKWRERPWLGWGMRTTHALIGQAKLDTGGVQHVHLHNAYLDTLVGIGLVGALMLGLVFVLLMRELVLAWRAGVITTATLWVFAGCFGIVLVANAFDSLLWRFEYSRAPLEILFGCCIAYGLIRRRRAKA